MCMEHISEQCSSFVAAKVVISERSSSNLSKNINIFYFQALTFKDGNLVSGSTEALIQHLVPTTEYNPDVSIDGKKHMFPHTVKCVLFDSRTTVIRFEDLRWYHWKHICLTDQHTLGK